MKLPNRRKRGDRKHDRKKHFHPKWIKEGLYSMKNKLGEIFGYRGFTKHPTKGWRNLRNCPHGHNLTLYVVENLRR